MLKPVYVLVGDLFFATKIVKTAESLGVQIRTFDSADRLLQAAKEREPMLLILDCEKLEKEAFRILQLIRSEKGWAAVPRIGYLSHSAQALKGEMRAAGCEQVYAKSEFTKELGNLLMRYTYGASPRV
jgi:CheY-like chemotaxis protein